MGLNAAIISSLEEPKHQLGGGVFLLYKPLTMECGGIAQSLFSLITPQIATYCFEVEMSSPSSSPSSGRSIFEISNLGSGSSRVEVISSSSGDSPPVDSKAFAALQVMRSWHDVDSVVSENLLGLIRVHYSVPKNYGLHAPLLD